MNERLTVGVIFGGRSVEHEVSVITAQQAMAALDSTRFHTVPIYVAKSGQWFSGDALLALKKFSDIDSLLRECKHVALLPDASAQGTLFEYPESRGIFGKSLQKIARLDVAMPLVHGSHGEDGTLAGLLELADMAYCGCGVPAAAISMDKWLTKSVMRDAGLPVLDAIKMSRPEWLANRDASLDAVEARFQYPIYVKPRSLGSSIGVSRVATRAELADAFDLAFVYDSDCVLEPAQDEIVEINCSVLGRRDDLRASVCEQPVSGGLLSYADKYLNKGGGTKSGKTGGMKNSQRIIPAPLSEELTRRIQDAAVSAVRSIGGEGVARVDFLVRPDKNEFLVNEINTVPGSLSFYLWSASGLSFTELTTRLIELALDRKREKSESSFSIDTWLLSGKPTA